MFEKKKLTVFLLVFCTIFIFVFLKPGIFGFDANYFYGVTCNWNVNTDSISTLSLFFFKSLPCNLGFFKLTGFFLFLISMLIVWKSGELINKKFGWLAALFSVVMPGFVLTLLSFEDDLLAMPLLFFSNYLMLKGFVEKKRTPKWLALGVIGFTGFFVWRGAWLYLLSYSFFFFPALVALLFSFQYIPFDTILVNVLPSFDAIENYPFLGLGTLSFGFIGAGIFLIQRIWLGLPFLILAILKGKYAVHFGFWLAMGFVVLARHLHSKPVFKKHIGIDLTQNLNRVLPFYCFVIAIGLGLNVFFFQAPLAYQLEAVKDTVYISQQIFFPIQNDWSYGYWIRFHGGFPSSEGGGGFEKFAEPLQNNVVLTEKNFNCFLVKKYGNGFLPGHELKLYLC